MDGAYQHVTYGEKLTLWQLGLITRPFGEGCPSAGVATFVSFSEILNDLGAGSLLLFKAGTPPPGGGGGGGSSETPLPRKGDGCPRTLVGPAEGRIFFWKNALYLPFFDPCFFLGPGSPLGVPPIPVGWVSTEPPLGLKKKLG